MPTQALSSKARNGGGRKYGGVERGAKRGVGGGSENFVEVGKKKASTADASAPLLV